MADAAALLALAARCEALQGPDVALDAELDEAFFGKRRSLPTGAVCMIPGAPLLFFTSSLDAVRALRARVLPDHQIEVVQYRLPSGAAWDCYERDAGRRTVGHALGARTEEGGRLAAMLRALAREG